LKTSVQPEEITSETCSVSGFGHDAHDVIVIEGTTGTARDKQTHLAGFPHEQTARCFEIKFQGSNRALRERDHPLRVSFAVLNAQGGCLQVGVVERQRDQLSAADAGGIERFQDGAVAHITRLNRRRGFNQSSCFCLREDTAGQALWLFWQLHNLHVIQVRAL
jgi:hypothetical protein